MEVAQRVWLKAFWGFDPANDGMLGFTRPGDRANFLNQWQPGDLVLIYGASTGHTEKHQRRQALGFLEIEPREIAHVERMSSLARTRRVQMDVHERWTFAVPVRRAWKVTAPVNIKSMAPVTYCAKNARNTASRGMLMQSNEVAAALTLPVVPVSVFGEAPVISVPPEPMEAVFRPSRGLKPNFGSRQSHYEDGETYLYLHRLDGDISALIGRNLLAMVGKVVVKVGYSNDPKRRCAELNSGFPPAAMTRWKPLIVSKPFDCADDAKAVEDQLKAELDRNVESLGNEFFLGPEAAITATFSNAVKRNELFIRAAS